jgi:hypothetical protein
MAEALDRALEDFDGALDRSDFARRKAFERVCKDSRWRWTPKELASLVGKPHREAAAVIGVGHSIDKSRSDQRVDRAADRRSTAGDCLRDIVQGRRFVGTDRGQKDPAGAVRALGGTVGEEVLRNGDITRRDGGR